MIIMAVYVLMTMSIQEGMLDETNITIKTLRAAEDWDGIKSDIEQFLQETSINRYILMYPSGGPMSDPLDYLEEVGEDETDTKMLLYIWAPLNADIKTELVDLLGIDSVPSSFTKGLFTYEADSEAVTEVDYNVSIATGSNSGKKDKKDKKDKKGVVNKAKNIGSKAKDGAKKFFGGKKKKK